MRREIVSNKQMQLLIFIYCIGAYLLFSIGGEVKEHAWMATILGVIFTIPVVIMYAKTMESYPGKNLFEIIDIIFGKCFGSILNMIFIFHLIFLGAYILNDFTDFIKLTALFNTPKFIPMLFIALLSIWILKEGIEVLAAWSHFLIRIILIFIVLIWILLIPQMKLTNIYPIFYIDIKSILKSGLSIVTIPFSEVVIFLSFFDYINKNEKVKNIFIKPLLIGGALVTLATLIDIMLIGGEGHFSYYYPGYEGIRRLKFQGEFQRVEIIVSIAFAIIQFLEINVCILGASKELEKVFSLNNYRDILIPVVLLLSNFAYIIFGSIEESMNFIKTLWPIYGIILQIILPGLVFIGVLVKKIIVPKFRKVK